MNKTFYIKYSHNGAVGIKTLSTPQGSKRDFPLETVGDLVAATKQTLSSKLGSIDPDELTLHYPKTAIDGSAIALPQSFHIVNALPLDTSLSPALKNSTTIASLGTLGTDEDSPLIIKAKDFSGIVKIIKQLYAFGPVDSIRNFAIPFDVLPWGKQLLKAVDDNQAVLLHGHWQSGKTSALRFLQSRAERKGVIAYYIDMLASATVLENSILDGRSIFKFLAGEISGLNSESVPEFESAPHFCRWIQTNHRMDLAPPLLLIDEYDAFLQVCRKDSRLLVQMNSFISYFRNTQRTFSSVVCAGTFSIVATQTGNADMDVDIEVSTLKKQESDDSFDKTVQPFDVVSPWNKQMLVETSPFDYRIFKTFSFNVFQSYGQQVDEYVIDDIWESTFGHPGFSMWLLVKAAQKSLGQGCSLSITEWMKSKRAVYYLELYQTPTLQKMLWKVKSSKTIAELLHRLVRDNQAYCSDSRFVSFLRAVGVARPSIDDSTILFFNSPIIRDALLQEFYPSYDGVTQILQLPQSIPNNYLLSVLFKAIPHLLASQLLDPLVVYSKGLAEAAIHAELYHILRSLFRSQPITILTETKVVDSSEMRCDIWLKTPNFTELGMELKTELKQKEIQEAASVQLLKYASCREPREMVLVNFLRKEIDSVIFPISVHPIGWEKYPNTAFSVLFVSVEGDLETGLRFRYASNGDRHWRNV